MNCRSARRRLSGPAGGIFSAGTKRRLERHLRECAACRAEEAVFQAGIEALKHPAVFDDADFTEAEWRVAIRAAVAGGKTAKSDRFARFFRPPGPSVISRECHSQRSSVTWNLSAPT